MREQLLTLEEWIFEQDILYGDGSLPLPLGILRLGDTREEERKARILAYVQQNTWLWKGCCGKSGYGIGGRKQYEFE